MIYLNVKRCSFPEFALRLAKNLQASKTVVIVLGFSVFFCGLAILELIAVADDPRLVSFYVSVFDKQGKPVENLTQKDFDALEDKRPQTITFLQFEKGSPISLGILIDVSRSMGRERINMALSWVKSLAERLKSPDEIYINAFSDEPQEVVDSISPEDYLAEALDHLGTGGQSRTGLAVDLALIKLREAKNRKRALLLISPGLDIAGPATLDHIARFRYPIYALGLRGTEGITGAVDRLKSLNVKGSALRVYANQSGGNALFVESAKDAEEALTTLCSEFKNQYRLEYISSNTKRDGKIRKIEVKVRDPNYETRYLRKYMAAHQ